MNWVLSEQAKQYHWAGVGALSVKWFRGGKALYDIGQGLFLTDDTTFLILNDGQHYQITIDAPKPVNSFCVFFAEGFAEQVAHALKADTEHLLDDPLQAFSQSIEFVQRTYPHDNLISPMLAAFSQQFSQLQSEKTWLDEQFHFLMRRLLKKHEGIQQDIQALPHVRRATREELYRRLYLARDYMIACSGQPLYLDEIAQVACLSPNHLLRTFKLMFQETPHQFLMRIRLANARQLLAQTDQSITQICFAVGFESLGSFSWLFKQKFGVSPREFRGQSGDF